MRATVHVVQEVAAAPQLLFPMVRCSLRVLQALQLLHYCIVDPMALWPLLQVLPAAARGWVQQEGCSEVVPSCKKMAALLLMVVQGLLVVVLPLLLSQASLQSHHPPLLARQTGWLIPPLAVHTPQQELQVMQLHGGWCLCAPV